MTRAESQHEGRVREGWGQRPLVGRLHVNCTCSRTMTSRLPKLVAFDLEYVRNLHFVRIYSRPEPD